MVFPISLQAWAQGSDEVREMCEAFYSECIKFEGQRAFFAESESTRYRNE